MQQKSFIDTKAYCIWIDLHPSIPQYDSPFQQCLAPRLPSCLTMTETGLDFVTMAD